ncbi:MAG TPA: ATP-dependent helicase [Candidatus Limnocylindrales bacterium]|nr:ATP-dependent helicase [Candidatus Limnocylindrales bacterium]
MIATDVKPSAALPHRLIAGLDPEQAAAATVPDGPALIIAPAGSGKTTTLIARLGVLVSRGVGPDRIAVATFNRAAASELSERIAIRLVPDCPAAERIEVRTLHALARQVVLDARGQQELVPDRLPLLRVLLRRHADSPDSDAQGRVDPLPDAAELDTEISAWKVEGRDPRHPSLVAEYRSMLAARGAIDFDDLVADATHLLESDATLRNRWQARFTHLCVDEFQDVDAGQLRLVRLLAAPQDNLFVVGDDDQTIYAWRLADVRRILGFGTLYPDARHVQLATNYRCPPDVVAASRRLIEHNAERFAKRIEAGAGPPAPVAAAVAQLAAFDSSVDEWADRLAALAAQEALAGRTICFLARTGSELNPIFASLVHAGVAHTAAGDPPALAGPVRQLVDGARQIPAHAPPFEALRRLRQRLGWLRAAGSDALGEDDHSALDALLGWSAAFARLDRFLAAYDSAVARIRQLRRADAPVELATVHAAKGREWQTVVVIGMEVDRFPNRRAIVESSNPGRAMEEERRLAYVAMTRATRTLVLAYDPGRASPFVAEAGVDRAGAERAGAATAPPRGQPP